MQPNGVPAAPTGGYQTGGWYGGFQYNGTGFTQPAGVEAIGANAGKAVNPTVVAATNVAQGLAPGTNEAYIAKQNGMSPTGIPGATGASGGGTGTAGTPSTTGGDVFNSPEILAAQKAITDRQAALTKAELDINDNPFTSASVADRKIQNLRTIAQTEIAPYQAELARLTNIAQTRYQAQQSASKTTTTTQDIGGIATAVTIDASGNVVKKVPIGVSGKGNGGFDTQAAAASMNQELSSVANSYGNISPADWQKAMNAWVNEGGKPADFIAYFGRYADTNRGDFDQAYGFKNPNPVWNVNGEKIGTVRKDGSVVK